MLRFSFLIFLLFANSALAQQNSIIAKINNHVITNVDLEDRYRFVLNFTQIKISSNQEKEALISQIIDKMIDEELIRQEGEKLQISVKDSDIENIIESNASRQKISLESFKNRLAAKNISFLSYKNQVKSDLLWSKIISESLKSRIKITDQEIREFLEQNKLETDITKYFIAEIFIENSQSSKVLAEKLYSELKNGGNFKNFVKQFSTSASAESGGEIGWVSKNDIHQKIYDAIKNLDRGSYSQVISMSDGEYIFKLLDKKKVINSSENDINFARNRIFMRELEIEGKSYLMDLRKQSFVEVYRNRL